jgi:hypothetical protein
VGLAITVFTDVQNLFLNIREKISLVFYDEMKLKYGTEEYVDCCTREKRESIWKLRGIKTGIKKGRCS